MFQPFIITLIVLKNKIRVYATCFWQSDDLLYNDLTLYGFGKAEWKNIEFVTDNSFDIAVILTSPHENHRSFVPEKAVTFFTEPPASPHHKNTTKNVCPMYLPLPWCFHSQHKEEVLSTSHNIKKSKFLSAVTSELCWLEGHQKRLGFLFHLDAIFTQGLDIFGRKQTGQIFSQFKNYRSELTDKYDGLIPYRYHFACENSFIPDYFTEKILDPILAECLCFYDGCTNIAAYLDHRAFIKIDVTNIQNSIDTIIRSIKNKEYFKRREFIVKEKRRILTELNPLNIIWATLNDKDLSKQFKL